MLVIRYEGGAALCWLLDMKEEKYFVGYYI